MKTQTRCCGAVALFWLGFTSLASADTLNNWSWCNPLPTGNTLRSVAFGGGSFVGVGEHGTIVASSDGTNWVVRTGQMLDPQPDFHGIAFGGDKFVAVGDGVIAVSHDFGVTWIHDDLRRRTGESVVLNGVAYGHGFFVSVGARSRVDRGPVVWTSPDGLDWTSRPLEAPANALQSVTFDNGIFVAVGEQGSVFTSADGKMWTKRNLSVSADLHSITAGNGLFVAVGASPFPVRFTQSVVVVSSDGANWTSLNSGFTEWLCAVTFRNGAFVAAGGGGRILSSTDGWQWTSRRAGDFDTLCGIASGNGALVGVGEGGTIVTSSDGETWIERRTGTARSFYDLAYGNDTFVAVGAYVVNSAGGVGSRSVIVRSTNGITWTSPVSTPAVELYSLTYGQGLFVAVGADNAQFPLRPAVYTSPDGMSWASRSLPSGNFPLWSVAYGAGRFVAVAENSMPEPETKILTSTNGISWTRVNAGTAFDLAGVTFGDGRFVAVGYRGTIVSSTDGTNWTSQPSGTTEYLNDIAFGSGQFVAVGGTGTILVSTSGSSWTRKESGTTSHLFCVAHDSGVFAVGGGSGLFLTSIAGDPWQRHAVPTGARLRGVAIGREAVVTVGDSGTILRSGPPASGFVATPDETTSTMSHSVNTEDVPSRSTRVTPLGATQGQPFPNEVHRISGISLLNDRVVQLSLTATPVAAFRDYYSIFPMEASTDLATWEPITALLRTNRLSTQPLLFADASALGSALRFYRTPLGPFNTAIPGPTGQDRVGGFVRQLRNPANPLRQSFMVSVWYPAQPKTGSLPGPYMDSKTAARWASAIGLNTTLFRESRAHGTPGAPIRGATERYPVILYSAGQTGPRTDNTEKCENLASHGYVVVAMDSPSTESWVFENGKVAAGDRYDTLSLDFGSRVNDAQFVLGEVARWHATDPLLAGRLDLDKIGMFGWSFGGAVATGASQKDPRLKACLILDGGGHPDMAGVEMNIPCIIMMVVGDSQPYLQRPRRDYRALFDRLRQSAYFVRFRNASHGSFGEFPWFTSPPDATQRRVATSIRAYMISFFNKHLKNLNDHFLDGAPNGHPDVEAFLRR